MPRKRISLRDLRDGVKVAGRFWSKVDMGPPDACWPWTACRYWTGYGKFRLDGRAAYANRVTWVLTHGPIPDGLDVLHRCDNPPCCNPAHLFLGDHSANMQDREAKGRHNAPRGERAGAAKLNDRIVATIRERWRNGERIVDLAREVGISTPVVWSIVHRRTWKHVP